MLQPRRNSPRRLATIYVLAVLMTAGSLSVVISGCASRRSASPEMSQQTPPEGAQGAYARVTTREQALYNNDVMRVQELEEFQGDMDERLRLIDEGADDTLAAEGEGKNGRFWGKVGVASYAILSVAMSLGMAALPFLI
jgi:hypothetical protein